VVWSFEVDLTKQIMDQSLAWPTRVCVHIELQWHLICLQHYQMRVQPT
jgi:hypothetical protein